MNTKAIKQLIFLLMFTAAMVVAAAGTAFAWDDSDVVGTVDSLIKENYKNGPQVQAVPLGTFTADVIRERGNADVGIVNGGDLKANLQAGSRTYGDLKTVYSDNKPLAVAEVTAAELWQILEYGVSHVVVNENEKTDAEASAFDGFPQISGIEYRYDISAPVGERILSVVLDGDIALGRYDNTTIKICATTEMLQGGYGYSGFKYTELGVGLIDAVADYMQDNSVESPENLGATSIGSFDNPLLSRGAIIAIAIFLIAIIYCMKNFRRRSRKENETF